MNAMSLAGAKWISSSRCDNSGPNCVEVANVGSAVVMRDSKLPDGGAHVLAARVARLPGRREGRRIRI
jgi:hypothetical protein